MTRRQLFQIQFGGAGGSAAGVDKCPVCKEEYQPITYAERKKGVGRWERDKEPFDIQNEVFPMAHSPSSYRAMVCRKCHTVFGQRLRGEL